MDENLWWYKKIYTKIIARGKLRGLDKTKLTVYYEKHHIKPRCVGGEDIDKNLVLLTYREHIIAHVILTRIYKDNADLIRAASFMLSVTREDENGNKIVIKLSNSKVAEEIKLRAVELNRGENSPSFGRKLTEEHKKILSIVNSHPKSESMKRKLSEINTGKHLTEETKQKLSRIHKGKKPNLSVEVREAKARRWRENNPSRNRDMSLLSPTRKEVIDSNGKIYPTIKIAAKENGISYERMRNLLKTNNSTFKYYNTTTTTY